MQERSKSRRLGRNAANAVSRHDEAREFTAAVVTYTRPLQKHANQAVCVCARVRVHVLSSLGKLPER